LPFFPAEAFEIKRREIREFYRSGAANVEERTIYISDQEAEAFIQAVGAELLESFGDLFASVRSKLTFHSQIEPSFVV
jgi:hypothetical protein